MAEATLAGLMIDAFFTDKFKGEYPTVTKASSPMKLSPVPNWDGALFLPLTKKTQSVMKSTAILPGRKTTHENRSRARRARTGADAR